jgi:fatty acid desaturase
MSNESPYKDSPRINWYRTPMDREVLATLTPRSNLQGFKQCLSHLGLAVLTGSLAFWAFKQTTSETWFWSVPLLLAALFAHGTICSFFGGAACHELGHWTVFKTKSLNLFFLRVFAFLGWWDYVWFRISHFKHHQVTTHHDYDGEVVLPQTFGLKEWRFWLSMFGWHPMATWYTIKVYVERAMGKMDNQWYEFVMPEDNEALRREHRNWARFHLALHGILALTFALTGNWILIFIVNIPRQYCGWLGFMCGLPQHFGMQPDVADHRRCCRTFITGPLPALLYWNMQYHIEHHMYPAVPFFNLPKLRKALEHDLPPAHKGLIPTWKEILEIRQKQIDDPSYYFVPQIPDNGQAETASVEDLAREQTIA